MAGKELARIGDIIDVDLRQGSWSDLTTDRIFLFKDPARDLGVGADRPRAPVRADRQHRGA